MALYNDERKHINSSATGVKRALTWHLAMDWLAEPEPGPELPVYRNFYRAKTSAAKPVGSCNRSTQATISGEVHRLGTWRDGELEAEWKFLFRPSLPVIK